MGTSDRKSLRLLGYDYRDGVFFLTVCTKSRKELFGGIWDNQVVLSPVGKIVQEEWLRSPRLRKQVTLDEWVIMPNHFHAIEWLETAYFPPASKIDAGAHARPELVEGAVRPYEEPPEPGRCGSAATSKGGFGMTRT
jgi:hypothetical protein